MAWPLRAVILPVALVALAVWPGRARPEGGALPKGDAAVDQGKATGPGPGTAKDLSCYDAFLRPVGGHGLFADGALFLLGQTSAIGKASDPKQPTVRQTLYKVKLGTSHTFAEPLLSLEHRTGVSLAAYGNPVSAVSAVAFLGSRHACYAGPAAAVNVTLAKKGDQAVRATGAFSFVETPDGRRLVDDKKRTLLEIDPLTFQTKAARSLAAHERGLWYDPGARNFVAWHDDGQQRGLVAYRTDDDKKPRRLAVLRGDRVLQRGDAFAVARLDVKANSLRIQELRDWSDVTAPGIFTIKLPKAYGVASAGVDAHFAKRLAVVYAVGYAAQRRWRRAMVYDYGKRKLLGTIVADPGTLLSWVGMDPTGAFVVAEARDGLSRISKAFKVFDVAAGKVTDVAITLP